MHDPLAYYYMKYPIDISSIARLTIGAKYVAVELTNGNIGVCATLDHKVATELPELSQPNIELTDHRIIINAYLNALLNYNQSYNKEDIFDKIDFAEYQKIVMVGYFKSLTEKFIKAKIDLKIFDQAQKNKLLTDMDSQSDFISKAEALILTSTSVFNGTFSDIINYTNNNCHTFMLGPSTIMDNEMFINKNIRVLFGATFSKSDERVHKIVKDGGGTKSFLPYMNKVYLTREV